MVAAILLPVDHVPPPQLRISCQGSNEGEGAARIVGSSWILDSSVLGTPYHGRREWQDYMGLLPSPGFAVHIAQGVVEIMHKRGDGPLEVVGQEVEKEAQPRLEEC
ncbi:hypothetical protein N7537_009404 [Penicillium hordei]|uniref:Uncharacterized protein n=1 Tax=Penicillium hordei TaxID=40994 RepID=A0AAD6GX47_9EURO|nr:uncharacterized protein N7537_009404 [Penicillium hordei]KAJ5592500.1 hypothetical protein N7537_009404 [Penicillium hordei]